MSTVPRMRYTICAVRPARPAQGHPDAGLIWPVPAEADGIALEPRDGTSVRRFVAREVEVGVVADTTVLVHADAIRAQVSVTDARVAVVCTKYDRGGGWIGGPIALALNIGSRVLAARRRRGTTLVGQVRYPWLCGVYSRNRVGLGGQELLRLVVEGDGARLYLELSLGRGESATSLATEIIRRAARFRLEHEEDATAAERAELTELASLAPLHWDKGAEELAGRDLPLSRPPTVRSARLGASGDRDLVTTRTVTDAGSDATTLVRPPVGQLARPRPPQPPPHPAEADDIAVVLRRPAEDDDLEITLRPKREPPD